MQIHIARDGKQLGPFSLEEINRQLAAGTLSLSDQAWYEGAAGWGGALHRARSNCRGSGQHGGGADFSLGRAGFGRSAWDGRPAKEN